jgi:hypothetical protein
LPAQSAGVPYESVMTLPEKAANATTAARC